MGCGNSKAEPEPPPRPRTRPPTARTRTAQPRSQHPSRPPSSQKQRYSSSTDDDSLLKPPSRSHPRSSHGSGGRSSRSGTRHGTRAGATRRGNLPDPILEEGSALLACSQPAEDSAIIFDLGALRAFIRSHVVNYYLPASTATVSRAIAQRILTLVFSGRSAELKTLAPTLLTELQPYWSDPANNGGPHLSALCETAVQLVQAIQSNPATWALGSWDDPGGGWVVYPSILRNGVEVLRSEIL